MESGRIKGTVKWFSARKGYGFIAPEDGDKDIFVHFSGIEMEGYKALQADDVVEFSVKAHTKGPIAVDVKILQSTQEDN